MSIDFLADIDCLSMIGMCKNAGKTTVFNHIIGQSRGFTLGLTSIGRDGEAVDLVTGTKKPEIGIKRGSILATAAGLLPLCDITREILHTTDIHTPLGEVVIVKARSDGNVQLAGPSMIEQLIALREMLCDFGAEKIIIDGAVGRQSLCSPALVQGTVLCVGASCGGSMEAVVAQTAYLCKLLTLPRFEGNREDAVFWDGALTDERIAEMELTDCNLVVQDAGRILMTKKGWEQLQYHGCNLQVVDTVKLIAVAINPFSHRGLHFDPKAFAHMMEEAVSVPVINAEEVRR